MAEEQQIVNVDLGDFTTQLRELKEAQDVIKVADREQSIRNKVDFSKNIFLCKFCIFSK